MNKEQILIEVNKINDYATDSSVTTGGIVAVSPNRNNFIHSWVINTHRVYDSTHTVLIGSIDDAIEIIHLFSGDDRDEVSMNLNRFFKLTNNEENYLHYVKTLKI